ncbi:MAG: hypothetical protein ACK4IY_05110 [Chitinophagales bacterium]
MDILLIILILVVGLVFMFIEIFLIPGTSVLTILGFSVLVIGVYLGYAEHGKTAGNWLFIGSIVGLGLTIYIGYRRIRSKKWALYTSIDSKVNTDDLSRFKTGETALSITALRPEGIALFAGDVRQTVYSIGEFVDKNTEIVIVKIDQNKIFVKPVKK